MFPFPFSFVAPTASGLADIDNVFSINMTAIDRVSGAGNVPG